MNFLIYAEIYPSKDTGGGVKGWFPQRKIIMMPYSEITVTRLTVHTRQHNYTGNQGRQSSLWSVSRQRTCKFWGRGNWRPTTHFFSQKTIQKLFYSRYSQCLRKVWKDEGNINGKAVFQHLLLFCFRCVLLGQMLWWESPWEQKAMQGQKSESTGCNFWVGESKQYRVWTWKVLTG